MGNARRVQEMVASQPSVAVTKGPIKDLIAEEAKERGLKLPVSINELMTDAAPTVPMPPSVGGGGGPVGSTGTAGGRSAMMGATKASTPSQFAGNSTAVRDLVDELVKIIDSKRDVESRINSLGLILDRDLLQWYKDKILDLGL